MRFFLNIHKKGTKQTERDQKKNAIFEIIGLPLLRLSTKGSGEEKRIKEQLDKYLNDSKDLQQSAMISCNDGFRPVSSLIEVMEE